MPSHVHEERVAPSMCGRLLEPAGDLFEEVEDPLHIEHVAVSPAEPDVACLAGLLHRPEHALGIGGRTTVMIQRLTPGRTESDVSAALIRHGLGGDVDLVYVPLNRKGTSNLGYAFVNFRIAEGAQECFRALGGHTMRGLTGRRACSVAFSTMQGGDFVRHVRALRMHGMQEALAARAAEAGQHGPPSEPSTYAAAVAAPTAPGAGSPGPYPTSQDAAWDRLISL